MNNQEQNQLALDFQKTFDTGSGKQVLANLKKITQDELSVIPIDNNGRIDIHAVMRNEGKRFVMIYIERMLKKNVNEERQIEAKSY